MANSKFSFDKSIIIAWESEQEISGIYKHDAVRNKLTARETRDLIDARIYSKPRFTRLPQWAQTRIYAFQSGCDSMISLFTEFKFTVKIEGKEYFGTSKELEAQGLLQSQISTFKVKSGFYWIGTDKEWSATAD